MSLVARFLEENGIPTLVWSNARDITSLAFTPRVLFTNYPLGNPVGRPNDLIDQRAGLLAGLKLLETATQPGVIIDSDRIWSTNSDWMQLIFSEAQPFLSDAAEAKRQIDLAASRSS